MDYEAALKITPNNEVLQADAQKIREIIESSDISRTVVDKHSDLISDVNHGDVDTDTDSD